MPEMANELQGVGAAIASAALGERVKLSDAQRTALAHATVADTFDAILPHIPDEIDQSQAAAIADLWVRELRLAFTQGFTRHLNNNAAYGQIDEVRIREAIHSDDRLTDRERTRIIAVLDSKVGMAGFREYILRDDRLTEDERASLLDALSADTPNDDSRQTLNTESEHAYISSISVEGFRGIGSPAILNLDPRPGLTLVFGGNGSGKSTFAEGLDVLLTGSTARFNNRGPEWQRSWINIHSPNSGAVECVFVAPRAGAQNISLRRSWTSDRLFSTGEKGLTFDETPDAQMEQLGWSDALPRAKPILGYAELGPLFEEEQDTGAFSSSMMRETVFAHHIRVRAGVSDALTERLIAYTESALLDGTIHELVSAWSSLHRDRINGNLDRRLHDVIRASSLDDKSVRYPAQMPWSAFVKTVKQTLGEREKVGYSVQKRWLFNIARAYQDQVAPEIQLLLADAFALYHLADEDYSAEVGSELDSTRVFELSRWYVHFSDYGARCMLYCQSLLEAIRQGRLDRFSQEIKENWSSIRADSSVRFDDLTLHEPYGAHGQLRRVLLGLSVDGVNVERGVLSQGELHSLALSVFLPTMMRSDSPFGFAVIDDPVQAMDEHGVDGLAQVLERAAKELQLVVFTHDRRLLDAVRDHKVDHTLIIVTRSEGSVVQCEVVSDPVAQALEDARIAAEESLDDNDSWADVGHHCRQALELACIRAARRTIERAGGDAADVKTLVSEVVAREPLQARKLMALAIWGDADRLEDVADYVKADEQHWGGWINETLEVLNTLTHGNPGEGGIQKARSAYNESLDDLIAATRDVIETIEKNRA